MGYFLVSKHSCLLPVPIPLSLSHTTEELQLHFIGIAQTLTHYLLLGSDKTAADDMNIVMDEEALATISSSFYKVGIIGVHS